MVQLQDLYQYSLRDVERYILSAEVPILEIKVMFWNSILKLIVALTDTITCLVAIILYLALIFAKVSVLIFPHAVSLANTVYQFHVTQLSWSDIVIEFCLITMLLLYIIFRKKILLYWSAFERNVSSKSRKFVRALPHILFFTIALITSFYGQKFLVPFTSPMVLPMTSIIIPACVTLRTLVVKDKMIVRYDMLRSQLLLWVVLGVYHAVATLFSVFPFSAYIIKILPLVRELSFVILLWIQLSSLFAKLVFESSIPFLNILAQKLPSFKMTSEMEEKSYSFISMLKYFKIISKQQEFALRSIMQDTVALIVVFIFLFIPSPFVYIGVVTTVFLIPIFKTYQHVSQNDEIITPRKSKKSKDNEYKPTENDFENSENNFKKWLRYWICIAVLWLLKIYSILKIWPSILMIVSLFLQHSYINGSNIVFQYIGESFGVLVERDKQIWEEKQKLIQNQDYKVLKKSISKAVNRKITFQEGNEETISHHATSFTEIKDE